jgi:hypothetical protein
MILIETIKSLKLGLYDLKCLPSRIQLVIIDLTQQFHQEISLLKRSNFLIRGRVSDNSETLVSHYVTNHDMVAGCGRSGD